MNLQKINLKEQIEKISSGLARLNEVNKQVSDFKIKSETISIKDTDDKDGYKKTCEFLGEVRPTRTALDKERKIATEPFRTLTSQVNDVYNDIIKDLENIEEPHKKSKKEYEDYKEEQKQKEAAAKQAIIDEKIKKIIEAGLEYDAQSGYYKNDRGIAVNVTSISVMSDDELNSLLQLASERRDEILQEKLAQEQKEQIINNRRSNLSALGVSFYNNEVSLIDAETNNPLKYNWDDLKEASDTDFNNALDSFSTQLTKNKKFLDDIKKEREEREAKQKEEEQNKEKQKRERVEFFQLKLKEAGFGFRYGITLEDSEFFFNLVNNANKTIEVKVSALLNNEVSVDDLISQANEIKQQKENELLKAKQEQEERELQNKKQAKKELISINNFLSRTTEAISTLQQESINFKVLDIHSSLLLNKISKAISEFKEDTKHLS